MTIIDRAHRRPEVNFRPFSNEPKHILKALNGQNILQTEKALMKLTLLGLGALAYCVTLLSLCLHLCLLDHVFQIWLKTKCVDTQKRVETNTK